MVDKSLIKERLTSFLKKHNLDSFLEIFIISFLYDKINYIEKFVGYENSLNMLDKYIYNLNDNIVAIKKLDKYHSIYSKYDFESKCLKYYTTNNYKKFETEILSNRNKKEFIIKEFKIMMYKEFETIINIYSLNGKIISNGFYIQDKNGKYPEFEGNYSNIIDIFSDLEVCNITNVNDRIKIYIDDEEQYFVYAKHASQRNSEVIEYVELWRKFLGDKMLYFAINNPKNYSEKMISDFNKKYAYVLETNYNFLLKSKDIFSLIEKYLLHIRDRINIEDNIKYHQDISVIFQLMNKKEKKFECIDYLLHASNDSIKLEYKYI